jgi:lipoprotein signal peptidase
VLKRVKKKLAIEELKVKFTILLFIFIDQIVKLAVLRFFGQLVSYNQGIAFGFFPSRWWLVINFFVLITIAIKLEQRWPKVLLLGGGLSNLIDRCFGQGVMDFINLPLFPSFNLADIYICLGVIMLLLIYVNPKSNLPG